MQTKVAVYADLSVPSKKISRLFYDILLVSAASLAIAISAQVYIPLGFTPVPVTGQTFTVLLAGALLGSRRGALAVMTYLGLGIAGMPLFAQGGAGLVRILGPTGGYLAGFVAAAFLTGALAEQGWDRRTPSAVLAMLTGNLMIYLFGLPRLAAFVGWEGVLTMGFLPFIPGDVIKLIAASALLPLGWKLLKPEATTTGSF